MMVYSRSSYHRVYLPNCLTTMSHPRQRRLNSVSMPPIVSSVEVPDPKPTSDNPASSKRKRRTIGEWFGTVITKRNHNRTPRQTPSDAPPQSAIASQTKAAPSNEKHSTLAPAKRKKLIAYKSPARPQAPKPATSSEPAKTTPHSKPGPASVPCKIKTEPSGARNEAPHSEVDPVSVPGENKTEPCGAQNNVMVKIHFECLAAEVHNNSCSVNMVA
ncbi:hypothetical protein HD554DRAFT_930922 [Boletus coccyginus]|nr:hypothetical protein HD554DRAFT_930922 [Boletus coccyginus]